MAFNLKQALEFNKYTLGLAAGGFAYVSKIAADSSNATLRWFGLAALACFAVATVFGVLVIGRATKLDEKATSDATIESHGKIHSVALLLGLAFAAIIMVISIWNGPKQ